MGVTAATYPLVDSTVPRIHTLVTATGSSTANAAASTAATVPRARFQVMPSTMPPARSGRLRPQGGKPGRVRARPPPWGGGLRPRRARIPPCGRRQRERPAHSVAGMDERAGATIEAQSLKKVYGNTTAVDGIDFQIKPGRVTGFLGPNGAGKSTTMRMILGLDLPTSGTVTVNGRGYQGQVWPLHEVGALLDTRAVHPGRSAYNHLLSLAAANGIARKRVDEVLEQVGLTSVAHKRAGGFSLGMSQRLGIAGALLGDPGALLFDEPVNGLDPEGILWIRTLMRTLATEGRTVLVSSHLMSEMALTADHLLVIGRGRMLADMPLSELIARNSGERVEVRSADP